MSMLFLKLQESKADTQKLIDFAGRDLANRFIAIKHKLKAPESDLYYWIKNKSVEDLEAMVMAAETSLSKRQQTKAADFGAELIAENDDWKVYHITTFAASKKYGRDTKWCITGIDDYGDKYWNSYTQDGVKFYFYITKGEYDSRGSRSKFALAVYDTGDYEIFDQQDNPVKHIPNAPEVSYLPDVGIKVIKHFVYDGTPIPDNVDECSIEKVTITPDVTIIEEKAFWGCYNLASVTIPDGITSIEDHAFASCEKLTTIVIPDSVTHVGAHAFDSCHSLTQVSFSKNLKAIPGWVFHNCTSLKQIEIPENIETIGPAAFLHCTNLTSIKFGSKVTKLEMMVLAECASLEHFTIPATITQIGASAFEDCKKLTTIEIPNSVTSLERRAFFGCANLQKAVIGEGITTLPAYAFSDCSRLHNVVLSKHLKSIDKFAFANCSMLTNITIPSEVVSIDILAFFGSTRLSKIRCAQDSAAAQYAYVNFIDVEFTENMKTSAVNTLFEEFRLYETMWD